PKVSITVSSGKWPTFTCGHFLWCRPLPSTKGAAIRLPLWRESMALGRLHTSSSPQGRTAGHLSRSDRATRYPTGKETYRESNASRPRQTGGVNQRTPPEPTPALADERSCLSEVDLGLEMLRRPENPASGIVRFTGLGGSICSIRWDHQRGEEK